MFYSFDADVAKEYGVDEAIMIANFQFWIAKNKANDVNYFDGHYWTYNSNKAFQELFPFWSAKTIRTTLEHLRDKGVLITGNYNTKTYDRTLWFAFADEEKWICPKRQMDLPISANGFVEIGTPIPDSKPDNIPDNKKEIIKEREKEKSFLNPDVSSFDSKVDTSAVETTASIVSSDPNEILTAVNGFRDVWNKKICTDHDWGRKIVLLNESRKKSLKVRLKEILPMRNSFCPEKPLLDFFFDNVLLVRISKSNFLQGMVEPTPNHPNRFKLSIDNIISPSFFAKLIDGTYDNDKNRF